MSESLEHLRQWVGRQQTHHDLATAWPIAALNATLNRQEPEPKLGQAIPLGWHWLYFLEILKKHLILVKNKTKIFLI